MTRRRRRGAPPSPRLRVVRTASGRECPPSVCSGSRSGNQAESTREEGRRAQGGERRRAQGGGRRRAQGGLPLPPLPPGLPLPPLPPGSRHEHCHLQESPAGGSPWGRGCRPARPPHGRFPQGGLPLPLLPTSTNRLEGWGEEPGREGEKSQAEKGRRAARRPPSPPPPPGLPLPLTSQASLSPSSHRAPSTNALNALSNY